MRVVIADDNLLVRKGIVALLGEAGFEVSAEAGTAAELLDAVDADAPDIAIVDIRMPPTQTEEGLVAAHAIRARHPGVAIVVLSSHVEHGVATRVLAEDPAGLGYLLKDRVTDLDDFAGTLRRVAAGGTALDPEDHAVEHYDAVLSTEPVDGETPHVILDDRLPNGDATGNILAVIPTSAGDALVAAALRLAAAGYRIAPAASLPAGKAPGMAAVVLTHREKQVVALLAEGASNKLIARRLGISVHTAKFHVAAILQKLGAVNRTDAIAIAMREGLVLV